MMLIARAGVALLVAAWGTGHSYALGQTLTAPAQLVGGDVVPATVARQQVDELRQKALQQDAELGFCERTQWRIVSDAEQTAFFDAMRVGSILADRLDSLCYLHEIKKAGKTPTGRWCVVIQVYSCEVGKRCATYEGASEQVFVEPGKVRWGLSSVEDCTAEPR